MDDVLLVTADSVRYDFVDSMPFIASLDPMLGITAGHYTRPSLAALHSASLFGSLKSKVVSPSIAEVLSENGYSCIGFASTPQADPTFDFDAGFGHYDNFVKGTGNPVKNRRSSLREFLGSFEVVREVYQRLFPMKAVLSGLPPDAEIIDKAITQFNGAEPPRFLWVHLMDCHRPYGRGEDALPRKIDRKAEAAGRSTLIGPGSVTDREHEIIKSVYRDALTRTDGQVKRLLADLDTDPIFIFTSDHGDEFGEEGYYYHQGYRRRVADSIIEVPVVIDGCDVDVNQLSLLDIGPTISERVGISSPDQWHGTDLGNANTEQAITIAPWHQKATVAWQDFDTKLVAKDADVSLIREQEHIEADRATVPVDVEARLRDLGYQDSG